jgi:hypothetical protein
VHQEVGGAVGNQVLFPERRRGVDEDHDLHHTGHRRERPQFRPDSRQEVEHQETEDVIERRSELGRSQRCI